jgi:hypothetical protein
VNSNALLAALGVPSANHHEYLNTPSVWQSRHHMVPTTNEAGVLYAPGVPGVWVHFDEAVEYAKRLGVTAGTVGLTAILIKDLFRVVSRT